MHVLDLTLPAPAANLALDEALLLAAEEGEGGEVLRFWELAERAVVLGAGCRLMEDVDEAACHADGVPILRRSSGGGTVLLGPGCLAFSLVLAYERDPGLRDVRGSYAVILDRIAAAVMPGAELAGISDLAVAGRKFSGNAQQRKRHYLLHHGTLLHAFDLTGIGRYLKAPIRQPAYRGGRLHLAFTCNLPVAADELKRILMAAWGASTPLEDCSLDRAGSLVADKYSRLEWTRRR